MEAAKGVLRGIGFAVWGVVSALQNPRLMKDYTQFAKSMGVVLLALYSAAIVLLFFALPIVVFVPGLALQLLALIPYWAISITKSRSPVSTNLLFFDEVREVNPSLYRELKDASSATKGRAWVSGVKDDVHRSWHFTRYSLLLLAFSVVPVVGPIVSFLGQIVLVTNRLGWNLLSVYTQDCRKMNYRQQKDWMRTYRWLIFGFTLPFAVLTSVPFVGPLLMGLAEGASVHLVAHIVSRDPGHRTWRDQHKREKRADAQEEVVPALSAGGLSARDGLVGLLCATTAAQSSVGCVPFQGSPATSGKCDPVVTYSNVYIAWDQTYESVDEGAANVTKLAGAFVPYSCRQALISFACLGSFLECSVDTTTFTPTVVLPCRSVCERVLTECSTFAIENGLASLLPDCDKTVELNGVVYPAFPPDGLVDCNVPPPGLVVGYSQADCPYPLKYNQDGEEYYQNNGYEGTDICVYPCPDPMFSDGEWAGVIVVDIVLNFLSFWLSFFLVVTFLLMPQKRRFPALIFFYFGLLSAIVGFVCLFFPAVRGGIEPLVCTEGTPKRLVTMSNAGEHDGGGVVCIIQGIILYYCPMAAMFWWLFLVLTVFELIVLERSTNFIKRFHLFYHIVAWGFPLIGVIILLASKNIGALSGVPSCFMAADHEAYGWVLFYGPLAVCLIIGSILMTLSVIKFAKIRFRFSGHTKDKIEQLVRMILLVMAYFLILAYPLAFRIYQRIIQDDLIDALREQVTCSATTATECDLTYRLNYGSLLLEVMDVSCYGIIIFITMCSSDMLIWWYYLLKAWATQSPRDALDISKDMIMGSGKWGESKNSTMSGATTKSSKNTNSHSHSQSFEDDDNDGSINNEDL